MTVHLAGSRSSWESVVKYMLLINAGAVDENGGAAGCTAYAATTRTRWPKRTCSVVWAGSRRPRQPTGGHLELAGTEAERAHLRRRLEDLR